jgi:uncharacterized GH25 family protein
MSRPTPIARRRRATRVPLIAALLLIATAVVASAHDMFLKPTRFFAPENAEVRVRVLNGTFVRSENSIARNRLADASVITPRGRVQLDTAEWSVTGDTSTFHIHSRSAGTYVIGASTKPNEIDLSADDFNLYLRDDGIPDILEARRTAGELERGARERYHKHVKTLVQVGDARSDHFATPMGYPAEIIPVQNPYALARGAPLQVRILVDGRPVANQYVLYGGTGSDNASFEQRSVRSDAQGIATIPLGAPGAYYIKFIHMAKVGTGGIDYESKWGSLTFGVR